MYPVWSFEEESFAKGRQNTPLGGAERLIIPTERFQRDTETLKGTWRPSEGTSMSQVRHIPIQTTPFSRRPNLYGPLNHDADAVVGSCDRTRPHPTRKRKRQLTPGPELAPRPPSSVGESASFDEQLNKLTARLRDKWNEKFNNLRRREEAVQKREEELHQREEAMATLVSDALQRHEAATKLEADFHDKDGQLREFLGEFTECTALLGAETTDAAAPPSSPGPLGDC